MGPNRRLTSRVSELYRLEVTTKETLRAINRPIIIIKGTLMTVCTLYQLGIRMVDDLWGDIYVNLNFV